MTTGPNPCAQTVLVVEDDPRIQTVIRILLEEEGFDVDAVESAEDALDRFPALPISIVLVDLMLPGMQGLELCRELRTRSDVPIVVVTARVDSHDVVAGLEAGADDYVTKPFVGKELTARIRALLRRVNTSTERMTQLRFGDLVVTPEAGEATMAGENIDLTKTEFRLLCELALHAGRVLNREQLLERVWDYGYFGDGRLVDTHIRRLRAKVEADPHRPTRIVTVRGLGYRLVP